MDEVRTAWLWLYKYMDEVRGGGAMLICVWCGLWMRAGCVGVLVVAAMPALAGGAISINVCSRRIASASEAGKVGEWGRPGGWCGGLGGFARRLVISSITVIDEIRKR